MIDITISSLDDVKSINDTESQYNVSFSNYDAYSDSITHLLQLEPKYKLFLHLKNFSTENKIYILKDAMSDKELQDPVLLLNIFNLIKNYNSYDDSYFSYEYTMFKDLEEILQIKLELKTDIKEYKTELAFWFLSCLNSLQKIEYTYADTVYSIPKAYKAILDQSDLILISNFINKANNIETKDLVLVDMAYAYITNICRKLAVTDTLLNDIGKVLKDNLESK